MSDMVKIRYVGLQPKKRASVLVPSCTTIWEGHGDIQEVHKSVALVLLDPNYSKIWQPVIEDRAATEPEQTSGLEGATDNTLPPADPAPDAPPVITEAEAKKRLTEVLQVIHQLIPGRDFTPEGKPTLVALRQLLGRDVTDVERNAAWDIAVARTVDPRKVKDALPAKAATPAKGGKPHAKAGKAASAQSEDAPE